MRIKPYILILLVVTLAFLIAAISIYAQIKNQKTTPVGATNEQPNIIEVKPADPSPDELRVGGSEKPKVDSQEVYGVAKASFYDRSVCGDRIYAVTCKTASGEVFNDEALTFAHKSLPFGTYVEFCYGGSCVTGRANDRGPFVGGRSFDLSRGLFSRISGLGRGVIIVDYRVIKEGR